jgi:hypothetical protein
MKGRSGQSHRPQSEAEIRADAERRAGDHQVHHADAAGAAHRAAGISAPAQYEQ